MSPEDFHDVSMRRTNQEVILGSVLLPPDPSILEYGIQFVGLDPYPVDQIARLFRLAKSTVSVATNGIVVSTTFHRRKGPVDPAGPTFRRFVETRIEGLSSTPIVLRGYYSQSRSFHWGAHNGWDEFLFEPQLEDGISSEVLEELRAANVRAVRIGMPGGIFAGWVDVVYRIDLIGFDWQTRPAIKWN